MDEQEIERIAEGLSDQAKECFDWVRPWSMIAPFRFGADEVEEAGVAERETTNGLTSFRVTPLGLRVRDYLINKDKTDG